ncbi:hypothetical protein I203_107776 [Kwoniella mangroviensis CBS 8507]|uniref:hypothetical protein n=1 Tax=Kwoniella mangroviensis CBS 8507 TaxID=1296122 RepID=UPI00080CE38D|nr:uncharacterized protein I203_08335 [Kwoniella mangroviensis CBS 8507]OCF62595.1 hypothetical protein I203_08335 [Kwoniella mangroviensis CBS 8507]
MSSSTPPITNPEPPSQLSSLASTLDASGSDIPSFLNNLLSPYLPPPLPPPNPVQPPDLAPIDKSLNELLTQLSLLSQDTNSAVEQSIHDVSRTVPRLAYDLQFMRESANGLSSSLGMVQDRFARQIDLSSGTGKHKDDLITNGNGVGEVNKTNKSLEKLTHLDKLKTRLESARDILREAESWSTLESELLGFIQNQNWLKAGNRLQEASRSMIVFQNTPTEYEDRKRLLVSLQNELENNLSKALKDNLDKGEIEQIEIFHQVFKLIDREEEFRNYYFNSKSSDLLKQWKDVKLVEISPTQTSTPVEGTDGISTQEGSIKFSDFLPQFYSSLVVTLETEVEQIPLIFSPHTAASTLATFVQTTFDALDPSPSARLSAISEFHGPEALPELIRSYKSAEELGVAIQSLIDRMTFNTQGGMLSGGDQLSTSPSNTITDRPPSAGIPAVSPSASTMTRSSSKRMSISRRFSRAPTISGPQPVDNSWENTLYEPFLDLQSTYATLERRYLEHIIRTDASLSSSIASSSRSSGKDIAKTLIDRVNVLFTRSEESINRCKEFTHGYGSLGLLSALEADLSTFLSDQQKSLIEQLRLSSGGNQKLRNGGGSNDDLDFEFEGLDSYSTEDWSSFQLGLHILESCKEVSTKLNQFEDKLEEHLVHDVGTVLKATQGEGYDVRSTTYGSISLLQQSTLNSIDLHTLINTRPIPKPILPITFRSMNDLIKSSQINLQSIILSPLINQLETYPHLQVWTQPDKPTRKGELHVPTFSLSPTDVISRVSEGLLDLLRVFEIYSKEVGLRFSLDTLPFVENTVYHGIDLDGQKGKEDIPSEIILSTWISSLSLNLLSHLTSTTLPSIRGLTAGGVNQLKTDLNYLSNAVGALDVVWDDLGKWEKAVELDENGWRKEMRELRGTEGLGEEGERDRDIVRSVGRMRGWV